MENKIADPSVENWVHSHSPSPVTFDLLPIPGVLYEQMR